jgi:hypothetical protein
MEEEEEEEEESRNGKLANWPSQQAWIYIYIYASSPSAA